VSCGDTRVSLVASDQGEWNNLVKGMPRGPTEARASVLGRNESARLQV
jgi:hypothetical protein